MASIEFRVKVVKSPDGTTATLAEVDGSIDASTIQQFQQVMDKLVERGVKNLILDCSNVKYINSTGLGTLLKYSDTFESIGGHIAFCRVPSKVMLVMEMLGFNALFNIVTDEATALRSFAGKLAPPPSVAVRTTPATAAASFGHASPAAPAPAAPAQAYSTPPSMPAVGATSGVSAPAQAPAGVFPFHTPCAGCRVTLDIIAVGKFKCPRCSAVLAVEPTGRVRFFASKKARPASITLPSNPQMADGAAQFVGKCAESVGINGSSVGQLVSAVGTVCKTLIERAYDNNGNNLIHVLVQPDASALTVKIADYGKALEFSSGSILNDAKLAPIVKAMDTVEHRVNAKGGNTITLIKVLN